MILAAPGQPAETQVLVVGSESTQGVCVRKNGYGIHIGKAPTASATVDLVVSYSI